MAKQNKVVNVLSKAALAGMVASAMLTSQAFAAVDAYTVKVGDDVFKYDKADLIASFLDKSEELDAPLYDDFVAKVSEGKGVYAFHDDKNGYVSFPSVSDAFLNAEEGTFNLNSFTESEEAEVVTVPTVKKVTVVDGAIKEETEGEVVTDELKVESVSAINGTGKVDLAGAIISRNPTFQVKFTEAYAQSTVSNKTIKIFKNGVQVPITTPNTYANTVEFNTQSPLEAGAEYTLVIDGIKNSEDKAFEKKEVAFKTATETVVKTVAVTGAGATNSVLYNPGYSAVANISGTWANATNKLQVTFDEAIDPSTLTSSTVKLIDVKTGKALAVEAKLNALKDRVDVQVVGTTDFLMPKTQYKLVFDGVKAANGTAVEEFNFEFSYNEAQPAVGNVYVGNTTNVVGTGSTVANLVNPSLNSILLSDKTTYKEGAKLVVDFGAANAKLNEASVNTNTFKLRVKDTKEEVAVTVKYVNDTNKVEIVPTATLKDNTEYEVVVSPYLKNVNGLTLGSKDTDEYKKTFRTLDITAPKVEEVSVVSGDLNDLKVGQTATIKVKFSEAIETPVRATGSYNDFIAGTNVGTNGSYFIAKADDNSNIESLIGSGAVTVSQTLSTDNKTLEISITPNNSTVRGKAFKVILAAYNPTRGNNSSYAIVDRSSADQTGVPNVMENDYTFSFTVEGDDTTAPKVVEGRAYQTASTYVALDGATNIDVSLTDEIQILLDDKASDINVATATVTLKDSTGSSTNYTVANGKLTLSEVNGKAAIKVDAAGLAAGAYELKLEGVKDTATTPNEMGTYKANFVIGSGASVSGISYVKVNSSDPTGYSAAAKASESNVKVQFSAAMNRSTITADSVKLYDGETLVPVTIDYDQLLANNFVVLKPQAPLASNKTYKVVVTTAVKDSNGNVVQQNAAQAPKDIMISATTANTAAPKLVSSVLDEAARTITLTFDQKIKTVNDVNVILTNPTNALDTITLANDSAGAAKFVKIDGTKVILTNYDAATANVDYQGQINLTGKDANGTITGTATVDFSVLTTKSWENDANDAKPVVNARTAINANGDFVLTFSEAVSIDDVKAALKLYNAKEAKDVQLFSSSVVASSFLPADSDYASVFTVNVPGFDAANEYIVSFAKESISDYAGFKNKDAYDATLAEDTTAPVVPVISTASDTLNQDAITITGTAEANSTITITGGAATATGTVDGSGNYSVSVNLTQDTVNTLSVKATDAAGNVSIAATVAITEDSTAPAAPVLGNLSISDEATGTKDTLTGAAGAVEANATVNVYSDAACTILVGTATAGADGSFAAIDLTDLSAGPEVTYYVVAVDVANNASTATAVAYTPAN